MKRDITPKPRTPGEPLKTGDRATLHIPVLLSGAEIASLYATLHYENHTPPEMAVTLWERLKRLLVERHLDPDPDDMYTFRSMTVTPQYLNTSGCGLVVTVEVEKL